MDIENVAFLYCPPITLQYCLFDMFDIGMELFPRRKTRPVPCRAQISAMLDILPIDFERAPVTSLEQKWEFCGFLSGFRPSHNQP